jgi:hypothetical protein
VRAALHIGRAGSAGGSNAHLSHAALRIGRARRAPAVARDACAVWLAEAAVHIAGAKATHATLAVAGTLARAREPDATALLARRALGARLADAGLTGEPRWAVAVRCALRSTHPRRASRKPVADVRRHASIGARRRRGRRWAARAVWELSTLVDRCAPFGRNAGTPLRPRRAAVAARRDCNAQPAPRLHRCGTRGSRLCRASFGPGSCPSADRTRPARGRGVRVCEASLRAQVAGTRPRPTTGSASSPSRASAPERACAQTSRLGPALRARRRTAASSRLTRPRRPAIPRSSSCTTLPAASLRGFVGACIRSRLGGRACGRTPSVA